MSDNPSVVVIDVEDVPGVVCVGIKAQGLKLAQIPELDNEEYLVVRVTRQELCDLAYSALTASGANVPDKPKGEK